MPAERADTLAEWLMAMPAADMAAADSAVAATWVAGSPAAMQAAASAAADMGAAGTANRIARESTSLRT
jgi:hypothetical protein